MPLLKFVNNDLSIPRSTSDTVGFSDSLTCIIDYNSATITDIVGFRELSPQDNLDIEWSNSLWEAYSTDFVEWDSNVFFERTRLLTITENLIEHLGLSDTLIETLKRNLTLDELTPFELLNYWEEKEFFWDSGGTTYEITVTDIVGLDSALTGTTIISTFTLSDTMGFSDDVSMSFFFALLDTLGLSENVSNETILPNLLLTDICGFDSEQTIGNIIQTKTLEDKIGLSDSLSSAMVITETMINQIGFLESYSTKDHILIWRSRTHNYVMGYGGGPYGAFEYGGGEANDVREFRVNVFNSLGTLLRDTVVTFSDKTDDDPFYVYSWDMNLADGIGYRHELTFDAYTIDTTGKYSEKRTVACSRLSNPCNITSGCIFWVDADQLLSLYPTDNMEVSDIYDMSGSVYGNHLHSLGNWEKPRYRLPGTFYDHGVLTTQADAYGYTGYFDSFDLAGVTGKCTFAVFGYTTGNTFYYRDFGSEPKWFLGYNTGMDYFYHSGLVYNGGVTRDYTWHLWACTVGGTGIDTYVYKDGICLANNQNGVYSPARFLIQAGGTATTYTTEFIMFNKVLNSLELNDLFGYFMDKYRM